jgi:hypothetical protein
MLSEKARRRNPDYPADFDEYLEECFDVKLGYAPRSYEEWQAEKAK